MFRRLFGGGRAELRLSDPNHVLESGIEIYAQPPGKKLENITLLSGGEKSMTAVGLLFATYMVKPSPFCLLDEIDAALDEANVLRFVQLLREFGNTSQFIVTPTTRRPSPAPRPSWASPWSSRVHQSHLVRLENVKAPPPSQSGKRTLRGGGRGPEAAWSFPSASTIPPGRRICPAPDPVRRNLVQV
jgi:chromosome segregation protein